MPRSPSTLERTARDDSHRASSGSQRGNVRSATEVGGGRRREILARLFASNRRLRALADRDPLTGALNRRGLERCLSRLCGSSARDIGGTRLPVLLVDCDDFKGINDAHGHAVGDAALIELVHRIRSCIRDRDPIARLGGDEFLILLPHTDLQAAERIARQICDRVAASPVIVGVVSVTFTVSIGVAEVRATKPLVTPLLHATRAALKRSKCDGKNRAVIASDQSGVHRRDGEESLFPRLAACEVEHQAIVSLAEGQVLGYEWWIRGPSADLRAPVDLFRVARQLGVEEAVDLAALRMTAVAVEGSSLPGRAHLNLLPSTLAAHPDEVIAILEPLRAASRRVLVEMSLERLGRCSDSLLDAVRRLRAAGFEIGLEDAGHGSTSLDAILALEPTLLKVRRQWVEALGERRGDAIRRARAMRRMGEALEMELGASGLEDPSELEVVRHLGFTSAQGRLFSAPR